MSLTTVPILGLTPPLEAAPLLALLLTAGAGAGALARFLRVPRVVGYLLAGLAVRFAVAAYVERTHSAEIDVNHVTGLAAEPLEPLVDLALGLILFSLGAVFDVTHLKRVGRRVFRIAVFDAVFVVAGVTLLCGLAAIASGLFPASTGIPLALLLGITALDLVDPLSPSFTAGDPLDEALEIFRRVDVGCLPVVDSSESQQVVGLVEQRDLLRTLHIRRPETADSG